jgi:glycosyltransferase involved in cell wall biosynthesis
MRIAFDGITYSHPQPGGYRTYTTSLVEHLALSDEDDEFVLYTDRPVSDSLPRNWRVEPLPVWISGAGVAFREQLVLPLRCRRAGAELLHSPCATGPLVCHCPQVVTLLDTIEFSTPLPSPRQTRLWAMRVYSRLVQARLVQLASAIITLSRYSKGQIAKRFGVPEARISVTYLAPRQVFHACDRTRSRVAARAKFGAVDYVLALASASPRKNIPHLLDEYARLSSQIRAHFPLVLVLSHPAPKAQLHRRAAMLGIEDHIRMLSRVPDDEMVALYGAAALFVFPSLEEGFGLPPLEAMACGTPVVASNTSSMPEVLQDAALLVHPTEPGALAEAMAAMLTEPGLSDEFARRGARRCRKFSWRATALQTLQVYRSVTDPSCCSQHFAGPS